MAADSPPARSDLELAAAGLARVAAFGPYFAVDVSPAARPAHGWRELTELWRDDVLAEQVARTRAAMAASSSVEQDAVPLRVAASVSSLAVFARLVSPMLAAALADGVLPAVAPADLRWQPTTGGPLPITITPTGTTWQGDARTAIGQRELAAAFEHDVLDQLVGPVLAGFGRLGVSTVVLRGNVVSSLGGAVTMLPGDREPGWAVVGELVTMPFLLDTAVVDRRSMVRRSCCLIYRMPGIGYCGDCVLAGRRRD